MGFEWKRGHESGVRESFSEFGPVAFAAGATAVKQNSWCCRSEFCGAAWPWKRPLEFCFSPPLATAGVDYRPAWATERRHRFGAGTETCRTIEQSAVTRDPGVEGVDEGIPMTISKIGIGSLTPFFSVSRSRCFALHGPAVGIAGHHFNGPAPTWMVALRNY